MQVAVIGAGLAGLTLASRLCRQGVNCVIIERERVVGGLARSFRYNNGATFDVGPHRFHTDNAEVLHFIKETLGDDLLWIPRNSQLHLFGKYIPWPITLRSILSLPPRLLAGASLDLVFRPKARTDSFEDYVIERYGKTLYRVFFKPYTERFLDYSCGNLHRDWAQTGISRATIDKKLDTSSLFSVLRSVLVARNVDTRFIYPQSGGIGVFAERLAQDIERHGGRILLGEEVSHLRSDGRRISTVVTRSGEELPVEHVFWSGSLDSLRALGHAPGTLARLHYMSSILFNYVTRHRIEQGFQWCYFGMGDVTIDRISVPRNFNPNLAPEGREALCVEASCSEESETWRDPSRLDCVVETTLLKAGLLKSLDCIESYNIEHIRETYPIYTLNYPRKLRATFEWVKDTWQNLTLLGRTARFWYNNMDHSIAAVLTAARRFAEDCERGVLRDGDAYGAEDRYLTE
jgi:protoporphyrinogen oxidase